MPANGPHLRLILAAFALFVFGCRSMPEYTPEDLRRMGAVSRTGIVKRHTGSYVTLDEGRLGTIQVFYTGHATQYIPSDYRTQVGDKVKVVYSSKKRSPGDVFYMGPKIQHGHKAYQIRSIHVPPKNRNQNMILHGTVLAVARGAASLDSAASLIVQPNDGPERTVKVYLSPDLSIRSRNDLRPLINCKVEIHTRRVPYRRANNYCFYVEKIYRYRGGVKTRVQLRSP